MLDFKNISVHYGLQDVLTNVSFRVNKGERVGVVGPNGSGKSTLFKIILGEMSTDHGELVIEEKPRIGSTRQHPEPDTPDETLLEYSMRGIPGFHELEQRMRALEEKLDSGDPNVLKEYGEVQTEFEHLGGYDLETRVKVALGGLGFTTEEFAKPFASFSGGWRMRAELSRVLASHPDLLLLDEPSNYLDLPAVDWLQKFLKQYRGTLMLISHDRYLLRTLTDIIVEVDAGTCTRYEGNLDWYLREREVRYQHLLQAKENQDHHREQLQRFVDRFRAQATKAAQAQSRQKLIDKIDEERIVLPKRYTQSGRLRLAEPPPSGIEMFRCENLFFSYDGVKNVLHDVAFNVSRGDKVALIGYNGLGKSTLMRIIAGARQPTSGKAVIGHNVIPGYLSQELAETIPPDLTVYRIAKNAWQGGTNLSGEKNFRNQLGAFGFDENDVEKQAGVLSGGEKIRLAFLRLFLQAPNFLLLDEPTTHLDLDGRRLLQEALQQYKGTILLVSHDIEFVRAVATSVLEITREGIRQFPGGYDYYCEKKAQMPAGTAKPVAAQTAAAAVTSDGQPRLTSRELRQQRAAERAKLAPKTKALKKKVETCEKKIEELQAALDAASEELFNPKPTTDFGEVNRKVRTLQFEIDRYTEDWEKAATELEELQNSLEG
ncbi:MAG: ABC-F family ATP-binding cassette domain-containing protein [Kiritimatiellae bacterium]|nr:ABC-F family ATP-binding cassette domain-containing protein [Kiritimatiellia bacterium]